MSVLNPRLYSLLILFRWQKRIHSVCFVNAVYVLFTLAMRFFQCLSYCFYPVNIYHFWVFCVSLPAIVHLFHFVSMSISHKILSGVFYFASLFTTIRDVSWYLTQYEIQSLCLFLCFLFLSLLLLFWQKQAWVWVVATSISILNLILQKHSLTMPTKKKNNDKSSNGKVYVVEWRKKHEKNNNESKLYFIFQFSNEQTQNGVLATENCTDRKGFFSRNDLKR